MTSQGRPLRANFTPVAGFTLKAIGQWARANLSANCTVCSDGLACFGAVSEAGCKHEPVVVGARKPRDVSEFDWSNTVLGNLKTSLSGAFHAFALDKYADRYLAAFSWRFNRRFIQRSLHERLLVAVLACTPHPLRVIRWTASAC